MRLEEQSVIVRDLFPAEYADLVVAVTELGGTTVLMVVLAVLFWSGWRRQSALVISYAVAGLALLLSIKALLGLPRPPEDALLIPLEEEREGYGFPSGHAFAATVVYGGLVAAYDRTRDVRSLAAAGTLVALVSLSRVVLGVHYLGDVIVGAVLGVAFLVAMARLTGGDPRRGFAIAFGLALVTVVIAGASEDSLLGLGGAIGGLCSAGWIDRLPDLRTRLETGALVAVGSGGAAAIQVAEAAVSFVPALVALYAALVAWVFLAPIAVGRLGIGATGTFRA
ncbi:phosphatase PAP2 family protein [Haloterrigena salifodinae]|uniref:Phosphatase PAP2 family protein n=1 Tax=Haloterrigena salifodinae TaxID=2675099 RepID=A0A8T8DWQ3_9EURY|nr:phosphatase PAP2 family protein [Haloterrigena salifodinae]QRV14028.1 phosphatase PAP2 family protein [Haloterrigena salifodinae]